jgi:tetratricopeptide (TPR) repeat protein
MTSRMFRGAVGQSLAALTAAVIGIQQGAALAQTAPAAAPAGAAPATAPAGGVAAAQDPFTVENLIGDSVSLSNQSYPEVENALQRFKNGDFQGAKEYLDLAKQKFPKLPPVDLLMAKLYVFARNGEQARALLESTVTNYPNDPEAYLLLADLAFAEGRTTESHALFEKAKGLVDKFSDNEKRQQNFQIRVLAGLAAVHQRRQEWQPANDLLVKWVELDPDSAAAHTRLGETLFRLKKPADAFNEFKKARELNVQSSHPYIVLGQLFTQDYTTQKAAKSPDAAKSLEQAKKAFEQAYKEDGKNEATARAYAEWLIQQDQLDQAQKVAEEMRKNSPQSVAALMLDGLVAKMRNDDAGAEEALTQVLSLDPSNAGAINLLALILSESPNLAQQEKALRYAQMNAERFGTNSQANITLAWILAKLGRSAESDAFLQKAVQGGQLNADSAYLVAKILVQKGQKENALKALEQVLQQAGAGMFMYRKEAEAMVKELGGTLPAAAGTVTTPAATPTATTLPVATPPAK